jgi:hypothetical protein
MDQVSNRFDHVLTMIDRGNCDGKEQDLMAWALMQSPSQSAPPGASAREKGLPKGSRKPHSKGNPKGQTTAAATVVSGSIFSRVDRYANSRLPMDLPPLKLYDRMIVSPLCQRAINPSYQIHFYLSPTVPGSAVL